MPAVVGTITVKAIALWVLKAAIAYAVWTLTAERLAFEGSRLATDLRTSRRGGNEPWRVIYGEARVGGIYVFARQSGNGLRYLDLVMVLAGHAVEEIGDLYADDTLITLDGNGDATAPSGYAGVLSVKKKLGDHSTTFPGLVTLYDVAPSHAWTDDHKVLGKAHVWIQVDLEASVFQSGLPNFQFQVKGKNDVYDPRDTSNKYTTNAALCLSDYLVNTQFGMGADYAAEIDETDLIAAANVCDEAVALDGGGTEDRYTCNGVLTTDNTRGENIEKLLTTMAGTITYTAGKWRVLPATWRAPTLSLDEDDLAGVVTVQPRLSARELFNSVKGLFVPSDLNNIATDFPPYVNSTYVTEDNGESLWRELDLPMTNSASMAQRIAKVHLERARQQITVNWPGKLGCYRLQVGDTVQVTLDRFGWVDKEFEVGDVVLRSQPEGEGEGAQLTCGLVLRETASAVFDWSAEETSYDLAADTNLSDISQQTAPTALVLTSDDTTALWVTPIIVLPRIKVAWTAPDPLDVLAYYEIEYREDGASSWLAAATVDKSQAVGYIQGVSIGETYDVRVRAVSAYGIASNWLTDQVVVGTIAQDGVNENMIYGGAFKYAVDWSVTDATPTKLLPDSTDGADTYTDKAQAYDDDEGTFAYGQVTGVGSQVLTLKGYGTGSSADTGYLEVLSATSIIRGGSVQFKKKHDGGSFELWGQQAGKYLTSPKSIKSSIFDVADLSTLECECKVTGSTSNSSCVNRVYEARWWSLTGGPYGFVQQNKGTVLGTVTPEYGEVWRPFPGLDPVEEVQLFTTGAHSVWQLWVSAEEAPTEDLEVALYNLDTDTTTVVLVIPKADIGTAWYAFAGRFTAQAEMMGSFEVRVRSESTKKIDFAFAMANRGSIIYPWMANQEEKGYHGEQPFGEVGDWPLGPWVADTGGRSVVKKTQVT